jgi:hypothetical protein
MTIIMVTRLCYVNHCSNNDQCNFNFSFSFFLFVEVVENGFCYHILEVMNSSSSAFMFISSYIFPLNEYLLITKS